MNHNALKLVKGIPPAPGDIQTPEPGILTSINLLYPSTFAIDTENGWTPGRAQPKSGIWTDVNTQSGRSLRAIDDQNVTETFILNANTQTEVAINQFMTKIERLAQDARDFWQTEHQVDPVYIEWWAYNGAGYQYALIYNMQIVDSVYVDPSAARTLTITVEREPYWTPIRPGECPKLYTYLANGNTPLVDFDYLDLDMSSSSPNTDDFLYATGINNDFSFTPASSYSAATDVNYVDIDAADIPGDAPALVRIDYELSGSDNNEPDVYISRDTKGRTFKVGTTDVLRYNSLNGSESQNGTLTADACGIAGNNVATEYIQTYTVPANNDPALNVSDIRVQSRTSTYLNQFRGRWAVFANAGQTNGSDGDLEMRLVAAISFSAIATPYAPMPFTSGASNCEDRFPFTYLGELTLPFNSEAYSDDLGRGLSETTIVWTLQFRNSVGSTRAVELLSIILMPLDEPTIAMKSTGYSTNNAPVASYDNTGYATHGKREPVAFTYNAPIELIGPALTLIPNVDNRLYFTIVTNSGSNGPTARADDTFSEIRINIIPRWRGVRDV